MTISVGSAGISPSSGARKPWATPRLECLGKASQLLRSGGGKLSCVGGDPGEMRLQKGGGNTCP